MTTTPHIEFNPYAEQRQVLNSDATFRTVVAGRRSGKTLLAAAETVRRAFRDGHDGWLAWWMTPGNDIAETGFNLMDRALPDRLVANSRASPPYRHEFPNGARIDYRTADGDANVSVGLDWLVVDEADKGVPETAINELRPTLLDTGGDALFISTPSKRAWFHDYYQRGQSEEYDRFDSWQWPSYANPHVPDDDIDAERAEMPDRVFRREYLAQFPDEQGAVFAVGEASESYTLPDDESPHAAAEPPYRVAADLARAEDYLAIVGLGANGRVSHLTRERGLTWRQAQERVERVASAHGDALVAIDATRDNKLVADLEAAGVAIEPVTFTSGRKQTLVENLAAGVENGDVTVPKGSMLATELQVFQYDVTRAGNIRYGAPQGHHDDTVDALAMAYDLPVRDGGGATVTLGGDSGESTGGGLDALVSEQARRRENRWK
jgi:phage terminase large subunit-like protein